MTGLPVTLVIAQAERRDFRLSLATFDGGTSVQHMDARMPRETWMLGAACAYARPSNNPWAAVRPFSYIKER